MHYISGALQQLSREVTLVQLLQLYAIDALPLKARPSLIFASPVAFFLQIYPNDQNHPNLHELTLILYFQRLSKEPQKGMAAACSSVDQGGGMYFRAPEKGARGAGHQNLGKRDLGNQMK